MKSNQLFALILKSMGVETKFRKSGNVYKTYQSNIQYIFDITRQMFTCVKPIMVFDGCEYAKQYVNERYSVSESDGRISLSRV